MNSREFENNQKDKNIGGILSLGGLALATGGALFEHKGLTQVGMTTFTAGIVLASLVEVYKIIKNSNQEPNSQTQHDSIQEA